MGPGPFCLKQASHLCSPFHNGKNVFLIFLAVQVLVAAHPATDGEKFERLNADDGQAPMLENTSGNASQEEYPVASPTATSPLMSATVPTSSPISGLDPSPPEASSTYDPVQISTSGLVGSISKESMPALKTRAKFVYVTLSPPLPLPAPEKISKDHLSQLKPFLSKEESYLGNDARLNEQLNFSARSQQKTSSVSRNLGTLEAGTDFLPYSTKGANSIKQGKEIRNPTQLWPWRATGKLYMETQDGTYVCTGSMISNAVLVTAAHCIAEYGVGFITMTSIKFCPGLFDNLAQYGCYEAIKASAPFSYLAGTDPCDPDSPGVVCENDVAAILLDKKQGYFCGERTGYYAVGTDGYSSFYNTRVEEVLTQVTQLGYPEAFDSGTRMIRTDAQSYWSAYNQMIMGSGQTSGSSGGPWLVNFGIDPSVSTDYVGFDPGMAVVGVTSWGYTSSLPRAQGASRFGTNTVFVNASNIATLAETVCIGFGARLCGPFYTG